MSVVPESFLSQYNTPQKTVPNIVGASQPYYYNTTNKSLMPAVYGPTPGVLGAATSNLSGRSSIPSSTPAVNDPTSIEKQLADEALAAELSQFDYERSNLLSSLGNLTSQKENNISSLNNELGVFESNINKQKDQTNRNVEEQTNRALSSAQDVQKSNRNTLRGLGILGSSAAGELLSKPLQQFDAEKARLSRLGMQRLSELDDSWRQALGSHSLALKEIETKFSQLSEQIQNDLRFNDRQKISAVAQAKAAFQARAAEIQDSLMGFRNTLASQQKNIAAELQALNNYSTPSANLSMIGGSTIKVDPKQSSTTAGIYQDNPEKRGDLLSNMFLG